MKPIKLTSSSLIFLFLSYILAGCHGDEPSFVAEGNEEEQSPDFYESLEKRAVDARSEFFGETQYSRSEIGRVVKLNETISRVDDSDALYVVNFANSEGFALVPANEDIEVLAVSDQGNINSIDDVEIPALKDYLERAQAYVAMRAIGDGSNDDDGPKQLGAWLQDTIINETIEPHLQTDRNDV